MKSRVISKRRLARELALQVLYTADMRDLAVAESLEVFRALSTEAGSEVRSFAYDIVKGVLEHLPTIDAEVSRRLQNWRIERLSMVDRNILRLAAWELLHVEDIPDRVSINEGIELAKKYGDEKSGQFVNGVLDAFLSHREGTEPSNRSRNTA